MHFFSSKSFLLFAIASLALHSTAVANECEDQYYALTTDACAPVEGSNQCPASCKESLDKLNTACSVDGATISDELYEASTDLAAALFFVDEPCNSTIADELLAQIDTTCQGRGALYQSTSVLFCDDDTTVCSQFCMDVQDDFYDSCTAEDSIMTEDPTSREISHMTISEVVMGVGVYMGDACREYEEGKAFKASSSGDSTTSSSSSSSSSLSKESSSGSLTSSYSAFSISIVSVMLPLIVASAFSP